MQGIVLCFALIMALQIGSLQASPNNLVPLHRLYSSSAGDHFYTASLEEAMNAVARFKYTNEGRPGSVASSTASGCDLTPVHRLYNNRNDHFYTANAAEASSAASIGYVNEGIAFYCAASQNECGATLPFYRYLVGGSDHFYTTNVDEGFTVVKNGGSYEGILCYIW